MTLQEPLISVIVPVYKVEEYIHKCVDSILNQTYKNLEIILVDDGSPDRCPEICDEYAAMDARVKVIHKENGGLSDARNAGLEVFKGEYVTFVDSDDFIALDCVEILYRNLIEFDSDFSVTNPIYCSENGTPISRPYRFTDEKGLIEKTTLLQYIFYFRHASTSAWGKLYKRKVFLCIRYPKGRVYEDLATIYHIVDVCNRISYVNTEKYYYVQRLNSIIRGKFNPSKLDLIYVLDEMCTFIKQKYPSCYPAALNRLISGNFHIYFQIPKDMPEYRAQRKEIKANIIRHRKTVLADRKASKDVRVALIISYFGFSAVEVIFKLNKKIKETLVE